jgi:integrase
MRRGELCGLRWADTDLDAGVLEVRHTLLEVGGQVMDGEPKTRAGQRLVYLDTRDKADWTSTATRLRAHQKAQRKARLRAGADWADHDLVFARFDGTPWRPSYVTRQFRVLAAQAGVRVIRLHDTRHTANSLMQEVGVPQEMRMRMVGHAGRGVNDGYTHRWPKPTAR